MGNEAPGAIGNGASGATGNEAPGAVPQAALLPGSPRTSPRGCRPPRGPPESLRSASGLPWGRQAAADDEILEPATLRPPSLVETGRGGLRLENAGGSVLERGEADGLLGDAGEAVGTARAPPRGTGHRGDDGAMEWTVTVERRDDGSMLVPLGADHRSGAAALRLGRTRTRPLRPREPPEAAGIPHSPAPSWAKASAKAIIISRTANAISTRPPAIMNGRATKNTGIWGDSLFTMPIAKLTTTA